MSIGVYKAENLITNEKYIGMSARLEKRIMEHKTPMRIAKGKLLLYEGIREYGLENFSFSVLEKVKDAELLPDREKFWIAKLNPEYNRSSGGKGNDDPLSEDAKKRISKAVKNIWKNKSEEERQKIIKNNLTGPKEGYVIPLAQRIATGKKLRGRKLSEEHRKKISQSLKGKPRSNIGHKKKVACYKDGVQIKVFESIRDAASHFGIHPSGITKVIKGTQDNAANYKWKLIK